MRDRTLWYFFRRRSVRPHPHRLQTTQTLRCRANRRSIGQREGATREKHVRCPAALMAAAPPSRHLERAYRNRRTSAVPRAPPAGRRSSRILESLSLPPVSLDSQDGVFVSLETSIRPANRHDDSHVVPIGSSIGGPAVEGVVQIQRDEEILPEFTLDCSVELQPLTAGVAQAWIVLSADIKIRLRPVVGIERQPEDENPFHVSRGGHIDATLVVDHYPCADGELCAIPVHEPRAHDSPHLGSQPQAEAFVCFEAGCAGHEPALPGIAKVRCLERSSIFPAGSIALFGLRQ